MRSIRTKTLLIMLVSGIVSSGIGLVVVSVLASFYEQDIDTMSDEEFLRIFGIISLIFLGLVIVFFIISSFILMNLFITKRIKKLELQTREVIKGNFESNINMKQKDEIGALAITYNKMLEELKKNEYLSKSFIRDYSHEIKTPLSSINGLATLINEQNDITKIKEYANIIEYESRRLAVMAVDLLKISEIESTSYIKQDNQINVTEMIRDILLLTESVWSSKNVELDIDLQEVVFTSNQTMVYTVLLNLITNAFKYTSNDTTVKISLVEEDNLAFSISNQGTLSQTDMDNIFKLFYTTDKNKSKRSSGVGLTLVKRILDRIGGRIEVESELDCVTFKVTFLNKNQEKKLD